MIKILILLLFGSRLIYGYSSRRIKDGKVIGTDKPYMVYLVKADKSPQKYDAWICGGALVTASFIVTSAACVEDIEFMYAIAGYKKYVTNDKLDTDPCTCAKKKKIIYSCVPRAYQLEYDKVEVWGHVDIAVVKVESPYDFNDESFKTVCSYIPKTIPINYESKLQDPGTDTIILGWGHLEKLRKPSDKTNYNQEMLHYAPTRIIDKAKCKEAYSSNSALLMTIDRYMICTQGNGRINDAGEVIDENDFANGKVDGCAPNAEKPDVDCTPLPNVTITTTTDKPICPPPSSNKKYRGFHRWDQKCQDRYDYGRRSRFMDILTELPQSKSLYASQILNSSSTKVYFDNYTTTISPNSSNIYNASQTNNVIHKTETLFKHNFSININRIPVIPVNNTILRSILFNKKTNRTNTENYIELIPKKSNSGPDFTTSKYIGNTGNNEFLIKESLLNDSSIRITEATPVNNTQIPKLTIESIVPKNEKNSTISQQNKLATNTAELYSTTDTTHYLINVTKSVNDERILFMESKNIYIINATQTPYVEVTQEIQYKEGRKNTRNATSNSTNPWSGLQGICQNDHGGPLVTWRGTHEVLIGVASIFRVEQDMNCTGPYLFTSTQCNGAFLDCVFNLMPGRRSNLCDTPPEERGFEMVERHISWMHHPDGPAQNEVLRSQPDFDLKEALELGRALNFGADSLSLVPVSTQTPKSDQAPVLTSMSHFGRQSGQSRALRDPEYPIEQDLTRGPVLDQASEQIFSDEIKFRADNASVYNF